MKKAQRSVRLSSEAQRVLNRKVARLTLNPAILALSSSTVDWSGRERESRKLSASDLILRAHKRFPKLPLSWAVEAYIALLASGELFVLEPFSVTPYSTLPTPVRRFSALSPSEKIRLGERWKRELEVLRKSA